MMHARKHKVRTAGLGGTKIVINYERRLSCAQGEPESTAIREQQIGEVRRGRQYVQCTYVDRS